MLIKQADDIKPSEITDKSAYLSRRKFLTHSIHAGLTGAAVGGGLFTPAGLKAQAAQLENVVPSQYTTDEEWTPLEDIRNYNNFAEFGMDKKDASRYAHQMVTEPWTITVAGECNKPGTYALEDIVRPHQLEERIYRLRCIEAFSMVIPWIGFPLGDLLKRFEPNSNAKYVAFTATLQPDVMRGLRNDKLQWPYREGLRIDEAMHPLTILSVGLYGEELMNVNGAPIRLVVPWKYGIKSIKSIVKIEFTREQPPTTWNLHNVTAFGFYSNVNPNVDHPDWSQAKERRIGEFLKRDTIMFNGYGDQVASMYSGMDLEQYF